MRGQCPIGEKFGRLTVLSRDDKSRAKGIVCVCRCDCGVVKSFHVNNLRRGFSKSCGCLQKELQAKRQLIDRTGEVYNRLKVVCRAGYKGAQASWTCQCSCGNVVEVAGNELGSGGIKSCGCLQKERAAQSSLTHGLSNTKEYRTWTAMKARCTNENRDNYRYYGARGITICDQWLMSFERFYTDMGPAPSELHSIERDNTDGNYEPGNCRWATQTEQMRNTSKSKLVEWLGKTISLVELSEVTGVAYDLLQARLVKGWDVNDAVTRPRYAR